ncbi:hypothetical protein KEM54_005366 [Ascosphaera aggregata]|nr:hypothetical protein KEM54_005366 [Ascosphaera aggregata]
MNKRKFYDQDEDDDDDYNDSVNTDRILIDTVDRDDTACSPSQPASSSSSAKKPRPDRTDQEEVYAKTIRALFDAQKRIHQQGLLAANSSFVPFEQLQRLALNEERPVQNRNRNHYAVIDSGIGIETDAETGADAVADVDADADADAGFNININASNTTITTINDPDQTTLLDYFNRRND